MIQFMPLNISNKNIVIINIEEGNVVDSNNKCSSVHRPSVRAVLYH